MFRTVRPVLGVNFPAAMMRLRRETSDGVTYLAVERDGTWWRLPESSGDDLVGFLGLDPADQDAAARLASEPATGRVIDAFAPKSLRCFSSWRAHWERAARNLARRNNKMAPAAIAVYETLTRKTFPPLRPGREFDRNPTYYTGNHLTVHGDGDPIAWPSYTELLDYELEIAFVITKPLLDASPEQAAAAIGGFLVFNDFSARDVQWREHTDGNFGPVVKTKTFASSMGAVVATPGSVDPALRGLSASVDVNGETWSTTSTDGMRFTPAEIVAHASTGEPLQAGELFTTGTLPLGCGMELDRWIKRGDTVTLTVDGIGTLSNTIAG